MAKMLALKLTSIGNSLGLVLPREALHRLEVEKGGTVYLTETPAGFRLTPHDPEFATQMEPARVIMKKRHATLRELAR